MVVGHYEAGRRRVIPLPWDRPPLTLNQRLHWRRKAQITADIRVVVHHAALLVDEPLGPCEAVLHWRPRDNRRRDQDNLVATLKPCLDALVLIGMLPDDDRKHVVRSWCEIHDADKAAGPAMWLELTEVIGLGPASTWDVWGEGA